MAVAKVIKLSDYHDVADLPKKENHGRCEKVNKYWKFCCDEPAEGGIFWTCNDDNELCCGHYYCKKHLDNEIRNVFGSSKVTVADSCLDIPKEDNEPRDQLIESMSDKESLEPILLSTVDSNTVKVVDSQGVTTIYDLSQKCDQEKARKLKSFSPIKDNLLEELEEFCAEFSE